MEPRETVLGLDQSYARTGLAVCMDGKLKVVRSVQMPSDASKCQKRELIREEVKTCLRTLLKRSERVYCVIEQTRFFSGGHVSFDYIKSTGALNATIADVCAAHGVECYSIDTRAWKSAVLGSCKKVENDFGVPPEKWLMVKRVIDLGFESAILREASKRKTKGVFERDGVKYEYDNDAADAAGIALSWTLSSPERFTLED